MPRSNDTLVRLIASRLVAKTRDSVSVGQIIEAIQEADNGSRNRLVRAVSRLESKETGDLILDMVKKKAALLAEAEAEEMLLDGQVSVEDLDKILS